MLNINMLHMIIIALEYYITLSASLCKERAPILVMSHHVDLNHPLSTMDAFGELLYYFLKPVEISNVQYKITD